MPARRQAGGTSSRAPSETRNHESSPEQGVVEGECLRDTAVGNELWEFDERGLMRRRGASINDATIIEAERLMHWPLGKRPEDHAGLSELGL